MKISKRWLSRYVELPSTDQELIDALTFSGIEVEAVEYLPALPDTVLTARVVSAEAIPDTDHLQVCQVEYGAGKVTQVVCGAPNCRAGMISILALPGTQLPELTIGSVKLKGVQSQGMLCSEKELGVSDNHSGIIELAPDTALGCSTSEIFELPDTLLELEITPNRPDLLGYLGIARDLHASLGARLTLPQINPSAGQPKTLPNLTLVLEAADKCPRYTARIIDGVKVGDSPQWLKNALIKSGSRPINNVVDVTNYVMFETGHPLHAFDYVRLEALDRDSRQPAIVVRNAKRGEAFLALDGKEYQLDEDDLVIGDGQKASALAGIIGGKDTSISEQTSCIVLEAAAFAPSTIRRSAFRHKISTDSSYRFERHLSPQAVAQVSDRAVELLLQLCGGELVNPLFDAYPEPLVPHYLALRPRRFQELIGYPMESQDMIRLLEALGCRFIQFGRWREGLIQDEKLIFCHHLEEEKAGKTEFSEIDCDHSLYFEIPSTRVDLTREADLIEELARLGGYDRIPQQTKISGIMDRHAWQLKRSLTDHFVFAGFSEVVNYSFGDPTQYSELGFSEAELERIGLRLVNPQSGNQSLLRVSLLPHLLTNLSYNLKHGEKNLRLMEFSKVYLQLDSVCSEPLRLTALMTGKDEAEHWLTKAVDSGFYHAKGIIESWMEYLRLEYVVQPGAELPWLVEDDSVIFLAAGTPLATLGKLRSAVAENAGIDMTLLKQDIWVLDIDVEALISVSRVKKTEFQSLPRYPMVVRDISFVIGRDVPYSAIASAIEAVNPVLISRVSVFDEYHGKQVPEGLRSVSLRMCLLDREKTLTDERVDQTLALVWEMLTRTWQVKKR